MLKRICRLMLMGIVMASAGGLSHGETERHSALTRILKTYIVESADGVNRFKYGALKDNAADTTALNAYLAGFDTINMDSLSRDEQFAAWANLYNALTVHHIIQRYPVKSIRSGYIVGPWKDVMIRVDGERISLDAIEHDILRPQFDDPRVHYAVNCASYGCPNLMPKAWEAATLDADLNAAASAYINHPRGVSAHRRGGLTVSTIYKWFKKDFEVDGGVLEHLRKHANAETRAKIDANPRIRKHAYDWGLNDSQ